MAAMTRDRGVSGTALKSTIRVVAAGLVVGGAALLIAPQGSLLARFTSLVNIGSRGLESDPNLAGRLDYWAEVTILNARYPFGTFGSPEVLLGTAVDSSWFRAFAQGSVLYAGALALLIAIAFLVPRSPHRQALRLLTVLVAVAGVTQTPMNYPVIVLFWALLGAELQSAEVARRLAQLAPTAREPSAIRPPGARPAPAGPPGIQPT